MNADGVRFREEQRFGQWWLWALVLVGAGAGWLPLVLTLSGADGSQTGPWWLVVATAAALGVGLPLLVGVARLIVEVGADRVTIRFRPFTVRTIDLAEVTSAEAVTYRPVRDYGGWGVKGWTRRKVAYNVSGNRGVLLTLRDGRTVLLGSQQPEALAAAIRPLLDRTSR